MLQYMLNDTMPCVIDARKGLKTEDILAALAEWIHNEGCNEQADTEPDARLHHANAEIVSRFGRCLLRRSLT